MQRTVRYRTEMARLAAINVAEQAGETMIHDNHDVNGPGHHELIFDTLPPDAPHVPTAVEVIETRLLSDPQQFGVVDLVALEFERLRERGL